MNFIHFVCILSSFSLVTQAAIVKRASGGGHSWNYFEQGPDTWPHEFKECSGKRQSPINIQKDQAEYDKNLKAFKFHGYDKNFKWNVTHNGHAVVVSRIEDLNTVVGVEGSDFDDKFELLQFHFHWGFNKYQGSEHLVDGEKFPLEMHLVHKSKQGAFTVLGFLFRVTEKNNEHLKDLLDAISLTKSAEHHHEVRFDLFSIIPAADDLSTYYRYSGSLTTPPCTEGVIWNVFTKHIEISASQLQSFHGNMLKINFREPQKVYGRKVFSSFSVSSDHGQSGNDHGSGHGSDHASGNKDKSKECVSGAPSSILKFEYSLFVLFTSLFVNKLY